MEAELRKIISRITRLKIEENQKDETNQQDVTITNQEFPKETGNKSRNDKVSIQELSKLIENITQAYNRDWEKEKLEFAQNFLARTWAGMPLPVLSICGKGTQEIRYSKYLGYFLDGTKSHGLGFRYLDELLTLVSKEDIDTYKAIIETEKWIGKANGKEGPVSCICDIVINSNNHVIFIEQKINSGESQNQKSETTQLVRYDEAIAANREFSDKKLVRIFLTPSGKRSVKSGEWKPVSHHDLVQTGFNLMNKGGLSNVARENLKRFLLDLLLGPFDKTENEIQELVELAKSCVLKPSFEERLRFDRLVTRNELLIKILMEG